MRIASIDLGTNTCLLLIADVDTAGVIHQIHHEQRFPRLGKQIDHSGSIRKEGFHEIAGIISHYRDIASDFNCDHLIACATSAVREARNKEEFLFFLQNSTSIEVEVLSGIDEAILSYQGAVSSFPGGLQQYAVLDIGGGSTEFSFSANGTVYSSSLHIGAVRITEKFFTFQPPAGQELTAARHFIQQALETIEGHSFLGMSLIGVAGTVTTLACLSQTLRSFDPRKISGYHLSAEQIDNWVLRLAQMNVDEILGLSDATIGRADILTAGTLILSLVLHQFKFPEIIVSERGLRYGLVLREWKRVHPLSF